MPEVLVVENVDVKPITLEKFPQEHGEDQFCRQAVEIVGQTWSQYDHVRYGSLS